jgi:hypothetical protein
MTRNQASVVQVVQRAFTFSLRPVLRMHGPVSVVQLIQGYLQAQILDPQTPRLPGPPCIFGSSFGKEYDSLLEQRMLSGQWVFVGYGCRTLQWMLRYETSQTFIVALTVRVEAP